MTAGVALVTGVGRRRSLGAAIALGLARDGWDLALNFWTPYDARIDLDRADDDPATIARECRELGVGVDLVPGDLAHPSTPVDVVREAAAMGTVTALVLSHAESVDSGILTTTVESWDRHFAVNARASWLMIQAFAEQLPPLPSPGAVTGRIVALTSDHTVGNLPYGASKGALDRLVIAAGVELADRGVRANVLNPGPIDTGWMSDDVRARLLSATPPMPTASGWGSDGRRRGAPAEPPRRAEPARADHRG